MTEKPDSGVAWMRKVLLQYDEGLLTANDVDYELFRHVVDPVLERAQQGGNTAWGSSWCGDTPPATESVVVRIERSGRDISVSPVEPKAEAKRIAAKMREDYPMNQHAREWADWIDQLP